MTAGTITIARLRKMGACEETLEFLSNRFGDSIEITKENAASCAEDIDWRWASENLLNEDQWELYQEAHDTHWKAYVDALDTRSKEYGEACATLEKGPWKKCKEARDKHWRVYIKACGLHWEEYVEACAKAFVTAYYSQGKSTGEH